MAESKSVVAWGRGTEKEDREGSRRNVRRRDDGFIHYCDCGDGFIGAHICQNVLHCTLRLCAAYCVTIILQ